MRESGLGLFPDGFPQQPNRYQLSPLRFHLFTAELPPQKNDWSKRKKEITHPPPAANSRTRTSTCQARVSRFHHSAASRACMSTSPSPPRRHHLNGRRNRPAAYEIELAAHFFTASGRRIFRSWRRRRTFFAFTNPSTSSRVSARSELTLLLAVYCCAICHRREPPSSAVPVVAGVNSGDHLAPHCCQST